MREYKIDGTAIPQGSKAISRAGFMYESNKNLKAWRKHATETLAKQHKTDTLQNALAVKAISRAGFLYESNKNLKAWRKHATETLAKQHKTDTLQNALAVRISIKFTRPKSVTRKHVTVKPDVDKLARAILDSATDAGVWRDDSQVVDLRITKDYTTYASEVQVQIWELEDNA